MHHNEPNDLSQNEMPASHPKHGGSSAGPHVDNYSSSTGEEQVDLFALLHGIWEERLLVLLSLLVSLALAMAYIYFASPLYKITMQIRPGITGYSDNGTPIRGWSTAAIAGWINDEQYRSILEDSTKSPPEEIKIRAIAGPSQELLLIYLYNHDPKKGGEILSSLFTNWVSSYVNRGGDSLIKLNLANINRTIDTHRTELNLLDEVKGKKIDMQIAAYEDQIANENSKIKLTQQLQEATKGSIERLRAQMNATHENTTELITVRDELLKAGSTQDLSLMLYLNVIQQNINYVSQLQERLVQLERDVIKHEEDELASMQKIEDLKRQLQSQQLEKKKVLADEKNAILRQIQQLEMQKQTIAPIEKVSGPLSSPQPVRPRKLLILSLAILLGGMFGITLAIAINAWKSHRGNYTSGRKA